MEESTCNFYFMMYNALRETFVFLQRTIQMILRRGMYCLKKMQMFLQIPFVFVVVYYNCIMNIMWFCKRTT